MPEPSVAHASYLSELTVTPTPDFRFNVFHGQPPALTIKQESNMNKANVVELPEIESHEMSQNDWFLVAHDGSIALAVD